MKKVQQVRKVQKVRKAFSFKAQRAFKIALNSLHKQVRIRPRLRLFTLILPIAILALAGSAQAAHFVDENKQKLVVNGSRVLASAENAPVSENNEIGQVLAARRSPFDFVMPADGLFSQGFSSWHRAVDIASSFGSSVRPVGAGIVEFAGFMNDGHGNTVIIDHGDGLKSSYAHLGKINVGVGNAVQSNIAIGTIGLTGRTTGPHLHLEVFDNGNMIDPKTILPRIEQDLTQI